MNDIFIDNNIAKNFASPVDKEYKKLINWLISKDENAYLVLSQKIQNEYLESSSQSKSRSNIAAIVNMLRKQGRTNEFSNSEIKQFQQKYFTKIIIKKHNLYSSNRDSNHIPIILMSERKKALTIDKGLTEVSEHL